MEPVEIKLIVNDVEYTVNITHIGEIIELPDGGGDLPIEYSTVPECPNEDVKALHDAISEYVTTAIKAAIEKAKLEDKDK